MSCRNSTGVYIFLVQKRGRFSVFRSSTSNPQPSLDLWTGVGSFSAGGCFQYRWHLRTGRSSLRGSRHLGEGFFRGQNPGVFFFSRRCPKGRREFPIHSIPKFGKIGAEIGRLLGGLTADSENKPVGTIGRCREESIRGRDGLLTLSWLLLKIVVARVWLSLGLKICLEHVNMKKWIPIVVFFLRFGTMFCHQEHHFDLTSIHLKTGMCFTKCWSVIFACIPTWTMKLKISSDTTSPQGTPCGGDHKTQSYMMYSIQIHNN